MMQRKTVSSVRISALRVIGSGGGAVSERPTGLTSSGSSERKARGSIRKRPIGPPMTLATTRPSVAMAMPISGAPARPRAVSSGDQAMIVPWPPSSEVEPSTTAMPSGRPAIQAPRAPTRFCTSRSPVVMTTRIASGLPPRRRSPIRALSPMPVKKTRSSRSRAWVSKETSTTPAS